MVSLLSGAVALTTRVTNCVPEAIEERRKRLEDLLYDFEDYTEAATFESERFTELQAAAKALALVVMEVIKKTRFDTPTLQMQAPPLPSKFPPLPPLPIDPRSPSISPGPGTPIGGTHPTRRPPTPPGKKSLRSSSPPPSMPRSPDNEVANGPRGTGPTDSPMEAAEAVSHPTRVVTSSSRRTLDRLNTNSVRSHRSMASNGTSRSRMSRISAGSLESLPPPAYTAAGEIIPPIPHLPQDRVEQALPSRASSPETVADQDRPHSSLNGQGGSQHMRIMSPPDTDMNGEGHSNQPLSRLSQGSQNSHGGRTKAWVSDQADASSRPPSTRPSSRYHEAHSVQALQNLQSLTIPEDQAVGIVRPKHSSVIDFSPLTPMLSQLGQFSIQTSIASSPSVDTTSPERSHMSPLSRATSIASTQIKTEEPLASQADDEAITMGSPSSSSNLLLTPLSLPAAALDQQLSPQPQKKQSSIPLNIFPAVTHALVPVPSVLSDEWPTVASDQGSVTGFSARSLASSQISGPVPREPDMSIGPGSSLYIMSGFCTGAQVFKSSMHQDGIRRMAGHVAGVSTATARCDNCSYGHAFSELDLDVNEKSTRATFPRADGVLFRMRLLYKSHLVAQRPSEAFYGCLFCAQTGAVVREGDATVFKHSDDLFRHLARHPQPLPAVSGVTVLYGKEILTTDPRVNDFDLWLTEDAVPPAQMPTPDILAKLPVATAAKDHVQRYAEKKLVRPDGKSADSLLQIFAGARIVGVEFVHNMGGKWCVGWHDGDWGYFPSKIVELEKPKPGRMDAPPMQFQGTGAMGSAVSVVAKWKWDPTVTIRDAAERGWIGFDKGERITNVGWPVVVEGAGGGREAWCWSGTNNKGRFGIFPRSHVDEATLKDELRPSTAGGRGGGGGGGRRKEKGGGKSTAKSLFGVRRRNSMASSRPGSASEIV